MERTKIKRKLPKPLPKEQQTPGNGEFNRRLCALENQVGAILEALLTCGGQPYKNNLVKLLGKK